MPADSALLKQTVLRVTVHLMLAVLHWWTYFLLHYYTRLLLFCHQRFVQVLDRTMPGFYCSLHSLLI